MADELSADNLALVLARLKALLGDNPPSDPTLTSFINQAVAAVERYTGQPCGLRTYTTTRVGAGLAWLSLPYAPVAELTAAKLDGATLDPAGLGLDGGAGLVYRSANRRDGWPCGSVVELTYSAGNATLPLWLVDVLALTAAQISTTPGGGAEVGSPAFKRSEEIPGVYSAAYSPWHGAGAGFIPPAARAMLDAQRDTSL